MPAFARTLRRARAVVCLLILVPSAVEGQDQRAFLDTTVNGADRGDRLVFLRGSDVLIGVDTLRSMSVDKFAGRREHIDGQELVSLASLAPDLTFEIDEIALRLRLTVTPDWLGRTVRDLAPGTPSSLEYRSTPSLFTNYSFSATGDSIDMFTESAYTIGEAVLYQTVNAAQNRIVRGLTNVTFDQRSEMRRWVAGDTFVGSSVLGGDALIAGISVSRDFTLAPYFMRHPTLSISTPVTTPSTVEVYVNGHRTMQEQVQPGQLDLRNLPLTAGTNDTQVVVRDAFGGTQVLETGYYMTTTALAPGVHDYQYAFGRRRRALGHSSFDYDEMVFTARHRLGLTEQLTTGARIEGGGSRLSGGPSANLRLAKGEVEAALGLSRAESRTGAAAQASFIYMAGRISAGATMRATSSHYASLSMGPFDLRPRAEVSIFGSVPIRVASLTVQHSQAFSDQVGHHRIAVLGSSRLSRKMELVGNVAHVSRQGLPSVDASLGFTLSFGSGSVASVSTVRSDHRTQQVLDVQRSLPIGTGYGYQVRAAAGSGGDLDGALQYQGDYGRYELRREIVGLTKQTALNISGAVVAIGGGLHATRAIRNSFALVRVPGVEGVRTYSNHQEIGRTNSRGDVLIPELLPYYGNPLTIADTDVPLDYEIPNTQVMLAPRYRAGAVVLFPVRRIQQIVGKVVLVANGREEVPMYGEATVSVATATQISPLGSNGDFYFENIPPGRHAAVVRYGSRSCAFPLVIEPSDQPMIALGTIECREAGEQPK